MGKTLFIENARKLRYEAGWVAVHRDGDPRPVLLRADELDCIVVDGKAAFISTYLLDELVARGCSVILTDSRHMPASILMPLTGATIDTNGKVLTQMSWGAWPRKMLWKKIVECKLDNQASVLEGSGHEQEAILLASYAGEVRADDSTGREAAGARRYFQALFGTGFVRVPHTDATNNALDYGYSVLLSHTACRIAAKGYLNQVGIHHHSKTNPYNLACDLMEPFRPLIDRKVELERPPRAHAVREEAPCVHARRQDSLWEWKLPGVGRHRPMGRRVPSGDGGDWRCGWNLDARNALMGSGGG